MVNLFLSASRRRRASCVAQKVGVFKLTQGHLVPLDCSELLANDSTCRNHCRRHPWNLLSSVYGCLLVPRRELKICSEEFYEFILGFFCCWFFLCKVLFLFCAKYAIVFHPWEIHVHSFFFNIDVLYKMYSYNTVPCWMYVPLQARHILLPNCNFGDNLMT